MAISRPRGRIWGFHAQKGRRGMWSPMALAVRREDESSVEAGRRRRSQAMWCGGGKFSWSVEMVGSCLLGCCWARPFQKGAPLLLTWLAGGSRPYCLLDWQGARAPIAYLIGRGLAPLLGGLVIFLLLLVAAKSWWKIDPLAVIHTGMSNNFLIMHD